MICSCFRVSLRPEICRGPRNEICSIPSQNKLPNHGDLGICASWYLREMHCWGLNLFWHGCYESQILGPQVIDFKGNKGRDLNLTLPFSNWHFGLGLFDPYGSKVNGQTFNRLEVHIVSIMRHGWIKCIIILHLKTHFLILENRYCEDNSIFSFFLSFFFWRHLEATVNLTSVHVLQTLNALGNFPSPLQDFSFLFKKETDNYDKCFVIYSNQMSCQSSLNVYEKDRVQIKIMAPVWFFNGIFFLLWKLKNISFQKMPAYFHERLRR